MATSSTSVRSFFTHLAAGLLGALFALILAYYAVGAFRDRLPLLTARNVTDFQARIAGFEERFRQQEQRLAALKEAVSAPERKTAQLEARDETLAARIGALKQEVGTLAKRVDERPAVAAVTAPPANITTPEALQQSLDPVKASIAELRTKLAAVEKAQTAMRTDNRSSALAVALYNLRKAVSEGKPFDTELRSVSSLSPVRLELGALKANRLKGVRNIAQLQASFEPAVNAAIDAENSQGDENFAGQVWARMKTLVRIRRVGEVPGDDTPAILARVETRLQAGNLRAAVEEADKLKGPAAAKFKPWLDAARARLAVNGSVAHVEASLLSALGNKKQDK